MIEFEKWSPSLKSAFLIIPFIMACWSSLLTLQMQQALGASASAKRPPALAHTLICGSSSLFTFTALPCV